MCEQTEISYLDGDVVWVKLGSCWWPGEVVAPEKLPSDLLPSFRKPPIAVVKFFQEDTYEYVKNINSIYKYNCSRKNEFINKGLYMYRTKHGMMEKFPEDVIRAETAVGGDIEILTRDEFQETKKESYAGLFGDPKKTPISTKKGKGRGRPLESPKVSTPTRKIKEKTDYKVHILVQGSTTPSSHNTEVSSNPSTSCADSEPSEDKSEPIEDKSGSDNDSTPQTQEKTQNGNKSVSPFSTPTVSSGGVYSCHACSFSTSRLNVLILHNKTHSVTFMPYTPSPVKKKPIKTSTKSTPTSVKSPKSSRPRKEKTEKPLKKKSQGQKRARDEPTEIAEVKKPKTDQEIKSSLLADWDDVDEESNDESSAMIMAGSPEVAVAAESPAVPTPAELPIVLPEEMTSPVEKKSDDLTSSEKPESSSDSKYEFCEDEDWPVEADVGRKIPRVKNPSKRKDETKSLSLDDDEMAREVAELLTKATVPELPSVPEPLKVEENFPEPSIVKSPDKEEKSPERTKSSDNVSGTPPKAIFKTKTFFRSRHSRSQDAIGKYVAEQLNIVERMDLSESEINGTDAVSSPEARESPPIEHIKVARLAPKIQLKKMKAEAAQLRETEKDYIEFLHDGPFTPKHISPTLPTLQLTSPSLETVKGSSPILDTTLNSVSPINETNFKSECPILETTPTPVVATHESTTKSANLTQEETELKIETACSVTVSKSNFKTDSPTLDSAIISPNETFENSFQPSSPVSENNATVDKFICNVLQKDNNNTSLKDNILHDVLYPTQEIKPVNEQFLGETTNKENNITVNKIERDIETDSIEITVQIDEDVSYSKNKFEPEIKFSPGLELKEVKGESEKNEKPYMNESTASAVDALLSVSREADRVTRVISDDPPEDLFEDDNKDNGTNSVNGLNNTDNSEDFINKNHEVELKIQNLEEKGLENGLNENRTLECDQKCEEYVEIDQFVSQKDGNGEIYGEETLAQPEISPNTLESIPSESDLQVAEALINLPSTAIQNKSCDQESINMPLESTMVTETEIMAEPEHMETDDKPVEPKEDIKTVEKEISAKSLLDQGNDVNIRFETELEKSENLNAAQSLVQMSESIDHKLSNLESNNSIKSNEGPEIEVLKQKNGIDSANENITIEQKVASLSKDNSNEPSKPAKYETTSSKLLMMLEEPSTPKITKTTPTKQISLSGKEKILNFDVAKSSFKPKSQPKSPVIIRRAAANKNLINNIAENASPDKIVFPRAKKPTVEGPPFKTYSIQAKPEVPVDTKTITIIQQNVKKITKASAKLQKIKPQNSLVTPINDNKTTKDPTVVEDALFDINSMPIVLSDDILTPESIEHMPIVMSDGNLMTNAAQPPKLVKTKQSIIEPEKPVLSAVVNKPEIKTLLMNPVSEVNKVATPNILSKSSKLRAAKPMLVIDKATGKQKIIMTKAEPTTVKEIKPAPTLIQAVPQNTGKAEKFIILPSASSPRPGRTQKIVIDPQTGKAHVLVAKGPDSSINMNDNKPVSAKLIPSSSDAASPGNTVMIITNAQGAQSRIVLTSEHEKILFPNKQQPNLSQLKTITHRMTTASATTQKTIVSPVPQVKTQTRIVPKQKNTIITSKGQLIVGGRVASTTHTQNIAPMPEIRPLQKRIIAAEPKKLIQTIQKSNSEHLIFLQQKSGNVVQLTASQFEHFQRTGQIIQKIQVPAQENKPVVQKTITISPGEPLGNIVQKQRVRKTVMESPTPAKKVRHEIAIAPAHSPITPMPALTPLSNTVVTTLGPSISNTVSVTTTSTYPDLDNLEEMLPSTAIARQPEPVISQPEPVPPPAPLADGQLLAVPGEHFGGPPGSFYLCVEDNGTLTPIDNRPLVLENNQLVPMAVEPVPMLAPQPERRDILEAALANSDVFHADPPRDEAPDFRDLNANVSVHCCVSETSTTLNQPIMTPVEVPSKGDSEPTVPSNLEDGLAVIGVTPHTVPTSLELPITVTDPRIAPKTTDPLSGNNYGTTLLPSPNTEMTFITTEEVDVPMGGPIHMPLLTDDEPSGKSMPILTDEVAERTVSSVESTVGSPSSIDVRESETEDSSQWSRRLHTPGSDTSETSSEIPLQPSIQLSVNEMRHS